ncbi:MAG: hypothetical protein M1540_06780 [Candidatus Bathyarchaeota archaeon]|nr:hypothetical protein [Candidatus Bathyarchaeota archaeon]
MASVAISVNSARIQPQPNPNKKFTQQNITENAFYNQLKLMLKTTRPLPPIKKLNFKLRLQAGFAGVSGLLSSKRKINANNTMNVDAA